MATKNTYQAQPQGTLTDDEFFARLDAVAGAAPEAAEKPKESAGVLRTAGDLGLKAAQGVVGLGQAAIGLGNLATGGLLGKGMRKAGYDAERTNRAIGEYLSDSQKETDRKVQEADGFIGTAQAMLENPRSIAAGIAESAPGMLLGGGVSSALARRIGLAAAAPVGGLQTAAGQAAAKAAVENAAGRLMLAGSATEGAQSAGQIAEKAESKGREWGDYVLPSIGAGVGTAAIGRATGKLLGDSETAIFTGAQSAAAKGASRATRAAKSGVSEGVEETLQSGQQQAMENIALGEKWDTDIGKAMGQGLVVGSMMGAGTGALTRGAPDPQTIGAAQQSGGIVSRAGLAATPGAQQPTQPTAGQPAPGATTADPAQAGATGQPGPAQAAPVNPIQASAQQAIEQALAEDKARRRAAGEVVDDDEDVTEDEVATPSDQLVAAPPTTTAPQQPASAGFSSPVVFDNSPVPKMDPALAEEQRRQFAELEQKRKNRRAGTRAAVWERNPFLGFLGANGVNRDVASEFAPGLVEKRKAFVPGYGPVFRPGAKSLDELVQNAKEDGFLQPDDDVPELYDLIDRALRGERIAPLYADGAAEAEGQRRLQAMQERDGADFEDYLAQAEAEDFDPFPLMDDSGYDEQDLAEIGRADVAVQNEVAALQQQYADLGFDPADVLESLAAQTENLSDQAYYDLAKSRFIQLLDQAYGQAEPQAEQGSDRAVRQPDGQEGDAQEDGSAAGGQAAGPVTPPAAPVAASPKRADAIRAKLDSLRGQGFSQFTRSGGRTLLLNPDTYESVELTPAEMAVAKAAAGQTRASLQSLRGQRRPAQVNPQGADVLQSYTPADVLAQDEQAQAAKAQQIAEQQAAADQAKANDERKRIEQASYAAADSFELGQNPLDSLTGQQDIFSAAKPVAQDLAGERINDEWTAFDPQSGTLGIPRAEMPQIKAEHRGAMMGFLKARGIDGQQEIIPSAAIKPTQAEFSPAKVKKAVDRQGGNRSIIVSADGYVVDGHHQWLAAREKGEPIPAIRLDQNIGDVLAALKDMPSAQPEQDEAAQPASLPPTIATDEAPELASQWATMTPDQRRRSRLEREIATGMTNNGGVMAKLQPSAIEKRKQELAAMGESGQLTAAPTTQESQAERGAQPDAGPQSDEPITSRPFATAIEKTKTGWKILGDPEALAQHARDIFGKGVVKRKDGISLATKNDDVAGNFPVRFEEYRLADLPEQHGRIEVRVNQDGSASVRSLDGGYMGPLLPSAAEAIADHRMTFSGGESRDVASEQSNPVGSAESSTRTPDVNTVDGESPDAFVPAPDGGLDYGEITPEMSKVMRRQAGKVRLTQGVQNPDGTGYGLAHIEARHGKEIRSAGFASVEEFLADAFQSVDEIWRPGSTSQLIAIQSGRTGKVAFIQLEVDRLGGSDYYRINSAFPANEKYVARKEKKEGWKPLWSRDPVPADASGASGFVDQSPEAGETAPTVSGQSGSESVAESTQGAQPVADLIAIFTGLAARGGKKRDAQQQADAHPQSTLIQQVQAQFHDILINLMDSGRLKVNGQSTVTEDNQSCL